MAQEHKKRKKHNRNTCFGCRLYSLMKELYPEGPQGNRDLYEILMTLATCSAEILQYTDKDGVKHYLAAIMAKVMEAQAGQSVSIH